MILTRGAHAYMSSDVSGRHTLDVCRVHYMWVVENARVKSALTRSTMLSIGAQHRCACGVERGTEAVLSETEAAVGCNAGYIGSTFLVRRRAVHA